MIGATGRCVALAHDVCCQNLLLRSRTKPPLERPGS
jgi:hypothetical protein